MPSLVTPVMAFQGASSPPVSRLAATSLRSVFDLGNQGASFNAPMQAAASQSVTSGLPDSGRVRVLVIDSDGDCLRRFATAVVADARLELLATADGTDDAMAALSLHRPEVLIVDPAMGQHFGLALIRHCAARLPQTDILVRTQVGDDERVLAAIEAGALGYVYRDAAPEWIVASIHALRDGGALISPGVARRVLARFRLRVVVTSGFGDLDPAAAPPACALSENEIGILRLMACGTGVHEIGEVLAIPPREVLAHVRSVYAHLVVRGKARTPAQPGPGTSSA